MKPINQIGPNPVQAPGTKAAQPVLKKYQTQDVSLVGTLLGKDQASLSESAKILAKAYQNLSETPEIRDDVVNSLRDQIESGEYSVPYDKLAERLAKRLYGASK